MNTTLIKWGLLSSLLVTLTSCSELDHSIAQSLKAPSVQKFQVAEDKETGCQYFYVGDSRPLSPRLNADGIPICRNTNKDIPPLQYQGIDAVVH
ncbi:hypothetical protein [Paenibacillus polymyxa]|uniref:hypothetical protein n=1 Tax=Paenibacillus polymyxa TaxID=1406 RepID=UPI002ED105A0